MPSQAKNQDNVPHEDLPYFIAATTAGIRRQLREAEIPTSGLKYELYLRLRANGLRIYNDSRGTPEPEDSDDLDDDLNSEDDDSESDDGGPNDRGHDEDESSDDSTSDNDDPSNPPSGGRNDRKRRRVEEEEDIEEPEATSLADMPAELAMNIVRNLDAGGVFNLVIASPQQFLAGNVNSFVLEAEGRRNAANRNRLSLLEWVVQRVGNEVEFRRNNRAMIRRVVGAYLATYPSGSSQNRSEETRVEEIMVYLREVGVGPVLGSAVRQGEADIVQLLIVLGEDVNQRVNNLQPLEEATVLISPTLLQMDRLLTVFALLAGGANTRSTRDNYPTPTPANTMVGFGGMAAAADERLVQIIQQPTWTPMDHPTNWPVINNPRGLTIREFLADERSPFMDRVILALVLIITRDTRYPNFEGYNPVFGFGGS